MSMMEDGFDYTLRRPESLALNRDTVSSLQIGIVTAVSSASKTVFVRIPAINESAALGPYRCVQPFDRVVETPVKQTVTTTSASDPDGGTFLTSATLSSTTTNLTGVFGNLILPVVGDRVVVLLVNDSLDEGVVIGKL